MSNPIFAIGGKPVDIDATVDATLPFPILNATNNCTLHASRRWTVVYMNYNGSSTVYLPIATDDVKIGDRVTVIDLYGNANPNNIVITCPDESVTVDGGANYTINTDRGAVTLIKGPDLNWWVESNRVA